MNKYRIKVQELNNGEKTFTVQSKSTTLIPKEVLVLPIFWVLLPLMLVVVIIFFFDYSDKGTFKTMKAAEIRIGILIEEENKKKQKKIEDKAANKAMKIKSIKYIKP